MIEYDNQILNEIRAKNKTAFENLYKMHYKKLYLISYKYVRNQEEAEEIVHDVFIKLWNNEITPAITQSLFNYLSRSVINTSINTINKIKSLSLKNERFSTEYNADTNDEAFTELRLLSLEKAIEELPPQCKKVITMSKFEKYKQQEIADMLNISIKTVKNHVTYAYNKIRNILSDNTDL